MERQEQQSSSVCAVDNNHWYCGMERLEERSQFQQNLNLGRKKFLCFYLKNHSKVRIWTQLLQYREGMFSGEILHYKCKIR